MEIQSFAVSGETEEETLYSQQFENMLSKEVIGQRRAVKTITRAVVRAMAGLNDPERPMGSFLFLGPVYTGKTEMARALARIFHGSEKNLTIVNCEDLGEHRDVAMVQGGGGPWGQSPQPQPVFRSLIGQENVAAPFSIVVLEEVEKAPKAFHNVLIRLFETGKLDLGGGDISLCNCLVILTSQLCTKEIVEISKESIGFQPAGIVENDKIDEKIYNVCISTVEDYFSPSFLGRLDRVLIFHRLKPEHIPFLLEKELFAFREKLISLGIGVVLDSSAKQFLIEKGLKDLRYGAMKLKRALKKYLEFPVADLLASKKLERGQFITVTAAAGNLSFLAPQKPGFAFPIREAPVVESAPVCGSPQQAPGPWERPAWAQAPSPWPEAFPQAPSPGAFPQAPSPCPFPYPGWNGWPV